MRRRISGGEAGYTMIFHFMTFLYGENNINNEKRLLLHFSSAGAAV